MIGSDKSCDMACFDRLCKSRVFSFFACVCSPLVEVFFQLLFIMWLASILMIMMLTMLTNTHADRSRPTLKDDERFRNGLLR